MSGTWRTNEICIVSGLPRSGTSMMMRVLGAGGVPIVEDGVRLANEDNPHGYFELERVKKLAEDDTWLDGSVGKAVKVISELLRHLPPRHAYRVIFMRRDLDEVLASQRAMLARRGEPSENADEGEVRRLFVRHLNEITDWLAAQDNIRTLFVNYGRTIRDAKRTAEAIDRFLGGDLDVPAMVAAVDTALHRNKAGGR